MRDRIRSILTRLENVREDLLALSDDIWLSIDHNDSKALQEGVQFKLAYNQQLGEFDLLSAELSQLVQKFTSTELEPAIEAGGSIHVSREKKSRLIRELDHHQAHTLDEQWRYKRPHGFILEGEPYSDLVSWRRVYELICFHLAERSPEIFAALPMNDVFLSNRGNRAFSNDHAELRQHMALPFGVYAETNYSADTIRETVRELLGVFGILEDKFRVYFREDRDAQK